MRTTLVDRADFVYVADLEPVLAPKGLFSVRISSIWRRATHPTEERVRLEMLMDRKGLEALEALIRQVRA